ISGYDTMCNDELLPAREPLGPSRVKAHNQIRDRYNRVAAQFARSRAGVRGLSAAKNAPMPQVSVDRRHDADWQAPRLQNRPLLHVDLDKDRYLARVEQCVPGGDRGHIGTDIA